MHTYLMTCPCCGEDVEFIVDSVSEVPHDIDTAWCDGCDDDITYEEVKAGECWSDDDQL